MSLHPLDTIYAQKLVAISTISLSSCREVHGKLIVYVLRECYIFKKNTGKWFIYQWKYGKSTSAVDWTESSIELDCHPTTNHRGALWQWLSRNVIKCQHWRPRFSIWLYRIIFKITIASQNYITNNTNNNFSFITFFKPNIEITLNFYNALR